MHIKTLKIFALTTLVAVASTYAAAPQPSSAPVAVAAQQSQPLTKKQRRQARRIQGQQQVQAAPSLSKAPIMQSPRMQNAKVRAQAGLSKATTAIKNDPQTRAAAQQFAGQSLMAALQAAQSGGGLKGMANSFAKAEEQNALQSGAGLAAAKIQGAQ